MVEGMKTSTKLIVTQIDEYARTTPSRVWAVIPTDDNDLSKGFKDITYSEFANAIGHACTWLKANLPPAHLPFETVAYVGPKDVRYPILAVAAAKIGKKLLLPSPFASVKAQAHLIRASECKTFLHGEQNTGVVHQVLSDSSAIYASALQVPPLSDWLFNEHSAGFQFTKLPDEAKDDPWLVFHTSGTTGLPKLITYTHGMMASFHNARSMPDADAETMLDHFANRRWYTPLPSLHFVGMTVALQFPIFCGSVVVIGPAGSGPTTPAAAREVMIQGQVQGSMLPTALIDGMCQTEEGLECLRNLDYLYFAGAPLSQSTVAKLSAHVPIKPAMGSTEAGAYFLQITGDEDWEYYSFRPGMGMQLQPTSSGGLYEAVFVRDASLEAWQQVFHVYPELQEFRTKDLFAKHASKTGFWKYVGRTDDLIIFSHGEDLYATGMEEEIAAAHDDISGVLIGGQGRPKPFLLVEWKGNDSAGERLAKLLPIVEHANRNCSELVKLTEGLILFTVPEKRLVRTIKGTVSRRESEELYRDEINSLYTV
ncbi:putative AMP-binding enzyme [Byssothecium circinans]|uniref:Putative AMP-binding enzyme n=1 Tax=Byssothecium circinans TaxID=147558 RepID=A0A6A5U6X0_9PLEO|nr:putative AMP-binding enzyme [Byssothecium circinans]